MLQWINEEMRSLDLRDQRLNRRAQKVVNDLAQVGESTPDAMRTKAALDGAYRLMDNQKVTPERFMEPHFHESIKRTAKHARVFIVQDTTEVNLTKPNRQVEGAGPLDADCRRGFYLHPMMAYTPSGVPLGLVDNIHWSRDQIDTSSSAEQKKLQRNAKPIEEKESCRWLKMTQRGMRLAQEHPQTTYVSISDSESDIYEVFSEANPRPENFHLLIRACQDRAIAKYEGTGVGEEPDAPRCISQALRMQSPLFEYEISVRARKAKTKVETRKRRESREQRAARVEVRACELTLRSPYRAARKLPNVTCRVVEVREVNPPEAESPILWTLVTTLPIDNKEDIQEIIDAYKVRWIIELYFRILKSGMGIEKLQYQTLPRYLNAVMPLMIVAWRVQMITQQLVRTHMTPARIILISINGNRSTWSRILINPFQTTRQQSLNVC